MSIFENVNPYKLKVGIMIIVHISGKPLDDSFGQIFRTI